MLVDIFVSSWLWRCFQPIWHYSFHLSLLNLLLKSPGPLPLSTCLDLQLCFQGCVDLRVKHIWTTVCPRDRLYVGGAKANKYTPHIFWILPVHLYRARQTLIIFLYPNVSTFYLFLFPIVCFLIYSSHSQYSCLQKESDKSFVCCKEQKSL